MIFQFSWQKILSGEKTQTRRLHKENEELNDPLFPSFRRVVTASGRTKWMEGNIYAIQPGRGKSAVARIRITDIKREDVRYIRTPDVLDEGYDTYAEFIITWCLMHDKAHYNKLAKTEPNIRQRLFDDRPAARYDAWVLSFELMQS